MAGELERILYHSAAFQAKLFQALAIVRKALHTAQRPYIAFSGGKDSTATLTLVELVRSGVHIAWSDDELELPETLDYMTLFQRMAGTQFSVYPGATIHAGWFVPWTDRPFWREPFTETVRTDQPYDIYLAEQGYDLVILGTRMEENRRRRDWLAQSGPIYGGVTITRRCCPLWDWTADDVWALIAGQGMPYNAAYDRMEACGIPRKRQRVGPMPLAPRSQLADGWPHTLARLESRYGKRWHD